MKTMPDRYDRFSILLHWLTALLVAEQWLGAQIIDWFDSGTPRVLPRSLHIVLGIVLAAVLVIRLLWRWLAGQRLPPIGDGWLAKAATAGHHLMYLLVVAALLTGLVNVWVRGDSLFGWFRIPSLAPGDRVLRGQVGDWHEVATNLLLFVAIGHAAMALWHHYWRNDGLLQRMMPGRR
jgi:cytochrome b561